jgi:hypothetical protein
MLRRRSDGPKRAARRLEERLRERRAAPPIAKRPSKPSTKCRSMVKPRGQAKVPVAEDLDSVVPRKGRRRPANVGEADTDIVEW